MRVTAIATMLLVSFVAIGATNQTSSVLDAAGRRSAGGALELISAAGQPGGIRVSSAGTLVNWAGFLNTFSLQPGLDTDGDGLANEVDLDNDNDTVADEDEITGVVYAGPGTTDPNDADSDGDSASDGHEAAAGSDPNDATMYLRITDVACGSALSEVTVVWQAQGGRSYAVHSLDTMHASRPGTHLGNVTAVGGTGPWFAVHTNLVDSMGAVTSRFYYVRLLP